MAHHFYLPELSEANISTPTEYGHWLNNEKKIFLGISDAILVDENAQTRGVSSIPDIWARPLLFQSAIKPNTKHPMQKKCIQEWRGLMSLLALHKIVPDLSALEIEAVELNDEKFSTALKNLAPSAIQLEEGKLYDWKHILIIRFDGIPLGAFSPSTLVFTGADYNKKLRDKAFPLKDKDGFLTPPKSKKEGIENVGEWLTNLQNQINAKDIFYSGQNNPDHQVVGNINHLIDDWLKEIRNELGLAEDEIIDAKKYKVSEDVLDIKKPSGFLKDYNVYKFLLQPLIVEDSSDEKSVSEVALVSKRVLEDYKHVIVINEKLLEEDVYLWGETRSKPLGDNPASIIEKYFNAASGTKIGLVDIGEKGGMWIRPELFFLSKELLKAKNGDFLTETESEFNIGTRYVLPFKKEILQFYSPKEIKELLNPVYKEDNGVVKFSFTLPLIGGKKVKVEKTYRAKGSQLEEGLIVESEVPVIEIFPDYLGKNWRRYYLFNGEAEKFSIAPLFATNSIALKDCVREAKFPEQLQKVRITEISGDNSFPEGIEIANEQGNALGVIFTNKTDRNQGLNDTWVVGIDYGTSNTNVYKKRGDADVAERWNYNFPQYIRQVTQTADIRKKLIEEFFFPVEEITLPIPTTLKVYDKSKLREGELLLDYFLYIPEKTYKFPDNILADIKWDSEDESKTKYYLESILFLILVEAIKQNVNKITLVCSFPKAFSFENELAYKTAWEIAFKKLLDYENQFRVLNRSRGNSEDQGVRLSINLPIFKTEGDASGEYFASELTIPKVEDRANKAKMAICLDVGGGTTDISIWYESVIEFDTSVLLAGRQIASFIQRNRRIRERLFSKDAAIALEEKEKEPVHFSARLNLILKREEKDIQQKLGDFIHDKDIKWLRQIIAIEFGAIAYYSAMVCISTNEMVRKKFTLSELMTESGVTLHWGGNAAKLINWIDFGKFNKEGIASKILNAVFFNALNNKSLGDKAIKPASLNQSQSPEHKCEAAGGLVVMDLDKESRKNSKDSYGIQNELGMPDETDGNAEPNFAGIVCGENVELLDKSIKFQMPLTNRSLFDENGSKFKSTTLEKFNHFIEVLNHFGIKNGLFNEDSKIVITDVEKRLINDGVFKEFSRMESLKEGNRLIEPIFIMEVKLLLDILKSKMN